MGKAEPTGPELTRRRLAVVLLGAVGLAGCGKKGDLYLPDQPEAPEGTVPEDNRTDDRNDNDDNNASDN